MPRENYGKMKTLLDFKKIEKISKALGDPYRLQILEAIKKQGKACMQCSDVNEMLNLSQPAVSHHSKLLVEADLIVPEKIGRYVQYTINKEVFADYIEYLSSFQK